MAHRQPERPASVWLRAPVPPAVGVVSISWPSPSRSSTASVLVAQQAAGGLLHQALSQLPFDRYPAIIAQLHDGIHCNAVMVVVVVVKRRPIEGLAQHTQMPDPQGDGP